MSQFFQLLEFCLTLSGAMGGHAAELAGIRDVAVADPPNKPDFMQKVAAVRRPALHQLDAGNSFYFVSFWKTMMECEVPDEWMLESLKPAIDGLNQARMVKEKAPRAVVRARLAAMEVVLVNANTPLGKKLAQKFENFENVASRHLAIAIGNDEGERLTQWFYTLSHSDSIYYINRARAKYRFVDVIQLMVNPDRKDLSEIPVEPRLSVIKTFFSHPMLPRIQPLHSDTFSKLIGKKCITPNELFENAEGLIAADPRRGMAYFDLGQVYRKERRYKEAIASLDEGMKKYLCSGSTLGRYLLEKAIIYRDWGKEDKARKMLDKVVLARQSTPNKALHKEIMKTLKPVEADGES